jgi:ribulose-phosphate 3-epimerase
MSVNPGFGGQEFIQPVLEKVVKLRSMIDEKGLDIRLEVDGGIKLDNLTEVASAGADTFVSGSAIFKEDNYREIILKMRKALLEVS